MNCSRPAWPNTGPSARTDWIAAVPEAGCRPERRAPGLRSCPSSEGDVVTNPVRPSLERRQNTPGMRGGVDRP